MNDQRRGGGTHGIGIERRLAMQQDMLAAFGKHALQHDDLDAVLEEACRFVAEGLQERFVKVLQVVEGEERLLLRAAVGFEPLRPDEAWLPGDGGSAGGYALKTGLPVLCNDSETETRFRRTKLTERRGIRSMVNVPIPNLGEGSGGPWFGVLEADSRQAHAFTGDEVNFLHLYANLIAAAVSRRDSHDRLQQALEIKERLLDELRHRVKNNLAVVTALARVQAARSGSEEARRHLDAFAQRVKTLALAYEKFYAQDPADRVELRAYLSELARGLLDFHAHEAGAVRLETDIAPGTVGSDVAVPLGMIVNEFVTNSLKYAFTADGTIGLILTRAGDEDCLVLFDDGRGMPTPAPGGTGIGLTLIEGLARQIGATTAWDARSGGTRLELRFRAR